MTGPDDAPDCPASEILLGVSLGQLRGRHAEQGHVILAGGAAEASADTFTGLMDHVGQGFEALGATSRSVSAQRLKGIGPLVPPDSSMVVAWAASSVPAGAVGGWLASGSQGLVMRFVADEQGLVLDVPALDVAS